MRGIIKRMRINFIYIFISFENGFILRSYHCITELFPWHATQSSQWPVKIREVIYLSTITQRCFQATFGQL